jgi:hypothetical protein
LQAQLSARTESDKPADHWKNLRSALDAIVVKLDEGDVAPTAAAGDVEAPVAPKVPARASSTPLASTPAAAAAPRPGTSRRSSAESSEPKRPAKASTIDFVHSFDTEGRDLERCGYVLPLHECPGRMRVVAKRSATDADEPGTALAEANVDSTWAQQILSGVMSPLSVLQCRLGASAPGTLSMMAALVGKDRLQRVHSRVGEQSEASGRAAWREAPVQASV